MSLILSMSNIDFTDYARITDILLWLDDIHTFNFTVALSKKNKLGNRQFFAFETEYPDGRDQLRSIKRTMNFYFTIDNREIFTAGMILRPQDVEYLNRIIADQILPWFFDPKKNVFKIINQQLTLKEYTPVVYTQSDSKYIVFEPCVITYDNGQYGQGINLKLASSTVQMDLDKFMGIVNLLKSDMYSIANSMINYTKIQPYGINTLQMSGLGSGKQNVFDRPEEISRFKSKPRTNSFLDNANKKT